MTITLTGSLHPSNKDAIDWNHKGIIVFGCHSALVFVDAMRLQVFRTIEQHKAVINMVYWQPEVSFLQNDERIDLKCASSDISGRICVFDVLAGTQISSFSHSNSAAIDMKWFKWEDAGCDFLLTLHSNVFILWNAITGQKIWEAKFSVHIFKFCINPFDSSNICFSSTNSNLLILSNVGITKAPNFSSVSQISLRQNDKSVKDNTFVHIQYHTAYPNLIFVVFVNEILCVEVQSEQIIFSAFMESNSPLSYLLPCARRDAFFLVQFNGSVSFRLASVAFCEEKMKAKLTYKRVCFSEAQRASSKVRVMGSALCPMTQSTVAVLYNSGKLILYQLKGGSFVDVESYRMRFVENVVTMSNDLRNVDADFRLSQYGILSSLCSTVTAARMRPLNTNGSITAAPATECRLNRINLAAIATSVGTVHLINVFTGKIERDLQIHSCPIKCLEWGSDNILISAAYSASLSSSATVRNDLFATDIRNGVKRRIRQEADESPIELVRVSYYQCYLAISFQNEPLEIWELSSMRLLRRMSRRCPVIVDMAWSGKHHNFKTVSETNIYRENLVVLDNDNHLYHVVVKGLHVRDGKEVSTQWKSGSTQLRCMVWKDDVLAFGDLAGRLGVWDLARSQCRQTGFTQSTRGPVLRCVFSRLAGDGTLAVQHPTSIVLWDTDKLQPLQSFQHVGLSIVDVDMCGVVPVYIASDGMFRFADDVGKSSSANRKLPVLLDREYTNALTDSVYNLSSLNRIDTSEMSSSDLEDFTLLKCQMESFTDFYERTRFVYSFLGRLATAQFIEIILYLSKGEHLTGQHLSTNLQLFWSSEFYRKHMENLTRVLLSCCRTEKQMDQGIEKCIVMGENNLATYFLLNNDHHPVSSTDFRLKALRACLLASNLESEESKCLVKMTATNLIACNYITDGIQLLFLIDQGLDACKYLISQGHWLQSVNYSKMHPKCDFDEILIKYVDHLLNENRSYQSLAIKLLASLGKWDRCRTLISNNAEQSKAKILDDLIRRMSEKEVEPKEETVITETADQVLPETI